MMPPPAREKSRNWVQQFGHRWFTLYILGYIVFGDWIMLSLAFRKPFPWFTAFCSALMAPSLTIVPWVGEHILRHHIAVIPSADYLFSYVDTAILIVLTLLMALLWTKLDRGTRNEKWLSEATRVVTRYALAGVLFLYGFLKVFGVQFTLPWPIHLMEPLGDLTPRGILWSFMGYSYPYSLFGGLAEVVGGILVLFRATTPLGALISAGVMANVVMMDTSYDVGVRLGSVHLMLMSLYLLLPKAQEIMNSLLDHRRGTPTIVFNRGRPARWLRPATILLKIVVIAILIYYPAMDNFNRAKATAVAPGAPMVGLYRVDSFRTDYPRFQGSRNAWERVAIESHGDLIDSPRAKKSEEPYKLAVRTGDDMMQYYALTVDRRDANDGVFRLLECNNYTCLNLILRRLGDHRFPNPLHIVLHYRIPAAAKPTTGTSPARLTLYGTVRGKAISMELNQIDLSSFALIRTSVPLIQPDEDELHNGDM